MYRFAMLFLAAATLLALQSGFVGCLGEITIKLQGYEQCEDWPETTMTLQDVQLTKTGPYKMKVDATITIAEEVEDLRFDLFLTQCESRDQQHTCTQDLKTSIVDICDHLADKNQMWTEGVEHILEFDPHCPIKPGVYKMVDAEFDAESFSRIPAIDGFWKLKNIAMDNEKIVGCQKAEVEIDTGLPLV
ncbi:uncharacterized protein LOC124616095 [Schistocerca americana]|uniref:uncharacterized protein LOC124616095 n=1 Tax=Schistocerca americana TaxID=7009 RepID=UPI001F4F6D50|nr:uncharacterized protein LOC124616095 [Schistocerca americana]